MKFINLIRESDYNPYDSITRLKCGPNFVLKQIKAFESMIREQGLTFWFRFWLTFCHTPGCDDIELTKDKWSDVITLIEIEIHKEFLQCSVESTINFGLEAIKSLKQHISLEKVSPGFRKNTMKALFTDLLREVIIMSFGASLCEIFYKWVTYSESDELDEYYWLLPKQYLNLEYKPEALEQYLVEFWEDNLVVLFGVRLRDVLWVLKLMYQPTEINNDTEIKDQNDTEGDVNLEDHIYLTPYLTYMAQMMSSMQNGRDEKRLKIIEDDTYIFPHAMSTKSEEMLIGEKEKVIIDLKTVEITTNEKQSKINKRRKHDDKIQARKSVHSLCDLCSCNLNPITHPNMKKCKKCVEEQWIQPKYYCSEVCRIEDWFLNHCKEHNAFAQNQL